MRPTTSSITFPQRPLAAGTGLEQVDTDASAAVESADDGAQRGRGAPVPPDDLAKVLRVHSNLEHTAAAQIAAAYSDLVGVIDDPPDEVFERFLEHWLSPRPCWLAWLRRRSRRSCPRPLAAPLPRPPVGLPSVLPSYVSWPWRWSPRPSARPTPA